MVPLFPTDSSSTPRVRVPCQLSCVRIWLPTEQPWISTRNLTVVMTACSRTRTLASRYHGGGCSVDRARFKPVSCVGAGPSAAWSSGTPPEQNFVHVGEHFLRMRATGFHGTNAIHHEVCGRSKHHLCIPFIVRAGEAQDCAKGGVAAFQALFMGWRRKKCGPLSVADRHFAQATLAMRVSTIAKLPLRF